jgi:Holliday junction resolvase RusA-like endonuclease
MSTIIDAWFVGFHVAGHPIPQGSKRWVGRMIEANEPTLRPWRMAVAAAAQDAMNRHPFHRKPVLCPLKLQIEFTYPRPRGHMGTGKNSRILRPSAPMHRTGPPDLDKLVRAFGDACTGIVFVDDSQIVELHAWKKFGSAGAKVLITELPTLISGRYEVIDRRRRLEGMSETDTPTPEPDEPSDPTPPEPPIPPEPDEPSPVEPE